MNQHSRNVVNHLLKNSRLLSKVKPEWFWEEKDWQCQKIVKALFESPINFGESALYENVKKDSSNFSKVDLMSFYNEQPTEPFDSCLYVLTSRYQKEIIRRQVSAITEMLPNSSTEEIFRKVMELGSNFPNITSVAKKPLEEFEQENPSLAKIWTPRRPALERLLPQYGGYWAIGGDSGHWKTNNGMDILTNAMEANKHDEDFKVVFFSKEMEWKQIRDRLMAKLLGVPRNEIIKRTVNVADIKKRFADEFPHYVDRFLIIPPDDISSISVIPQILLEIKPKVWCFDYVQLLAGADSMDVNTAVRAAAILSKAYCRISNSLGILLSQLRKRDQQRQLQFPLIDDLEYAGALKHQANAVGLCWWAYKHNNTYDKTVYITSWQKNRDENIFNEYLRLNPECSDMFYDPSFFSPNKKLKAEYQKYTEI